MALLYRLVGTVWYKPIAVLGGDPFVETAIVDNTNTSIVDHLGNELFAGYYP